MDAAVEGGDQKVSLIRRYSECALDEPPRHL